MISLVAAVLLAQAAAPDAAPVANGAVKIAVYDIDADGDRVLSRVVTDALAEEIRKLDGVSVAPLFTGKKVERQKPLFWEYLWVPAGPHFARSA